MNKIKIEHLNIGTKCDVCNEIPKGFDNTYMLEIGENKIKICDECLNELSFVIEN